MDTVELFASQWQSFKQKWQQIVCEAEKLRRKLNFLTVEPTIKELLERKEKLKKKVPKLKKEVEMHEGNISRKFYALKYRQEAMTSRKTQQELAEKLKKGKNRLAHLERSGASETIIGNEREMIWELEGPINEVEEFYKEKNKNDEQKLKAAQQVLDETLAYITAIEEYYRQTKKYLKEEVRKMERMRDQCRVDGLEWATQSRDHLEWMLEHEPSYKEAVVSRYKTRFPADNLSDLFGPVSVSSSAPPKANNKRRRSKPNCSCPSVAKTVPIILQPWRFWVTFNPNNPGQELPQEKSQFLEMLQSILNQLPCQNLNAGLVLNKLILVCKMSIPQRHKIKQVREGKFLGWKILRAGGEYRLFLMINEKERYVRFFPCQRKKSYSNY